MKENSLPLSEIELPFLGGQFCTLMTASTWTVVRFNHFLSTKVKKVKVPLTDPKAGGGVEV
jgi:hypothetical protein